MVDRVAILAENGRASLRGMSQTGPTDFRVWQDDDENPLYTLDLANLLGSATISSVVRTAAGTVLSAESNTTTRVIQRLNKPGIVEIKVTASDGQVFQYRIAITPKIQGQYQRDYGWGWGL